MSHIVYVFALVVVLSLVRSGEGALANCSHTFRSGRTWDLSPLAKQYPADYPLMVEAEDPNGTPEAFYWTPCNTISRAGQCQVLGATFCLSWNFQYTYRCGALVNTTWAERKSLTHNTQYTPHLQLVVSNFFFVLLTVSPSQLLLTIEGGEDGRVVFISITCDPSAPSNSTLIPYEGNNPEQYLFHYYFRWASSAAWACPTTKSGNLIASA